MIIVTLHAITVVLGVAVHACAPGPRFPLHKPQLARSHTVGSALRVLGNVLAVAAIESYHDMRAMLAWSAWHWAPGTAAALAAQLAAYVLCADAWFYYAHRLLHAPALYRHIHALHHARHAPTALDALNAHPMEHLVANIGSMLCGPALLDAIGVWQCWEGLLLWIVLSTWSTCAAHSGVPPRWGGLVGTHELHDLHHRFQCHNFGVGFYVFDWLHGTLRSAHDFQPGR